MGLTVGKRCPKTDSEWKILIIKYCTFFCWMQTFSISSLSLSSPCSHQSSCFEPSLSIIDTLRSGIWSWNDGPIKYMKTKIYLTARIMFLLFWSNIHKLSYWLEISPCPSLLNGWKTHLYCIRINWFVKLEFQLRIRNLAKMGFVWVYHLSCGLWKKLTGRWCVDCR